MMTSTGTRRDRPDDAAARTDVLPLPGTPGNRVGVVPPAARHARPQPVPVAPWPVGAPPAGAFGVIAPARAPEPTRPGLRWGWLAIGVVAAVLAVAGLASFAAAHSTMTVQGTVALYGYGTATVGGACSQPMAQGMPVTVYDASGSLVGTATLSGTGVGRDTWNTYYSSSYADSCEYTFSVPDVTTSSSHYRVKVGSGANDGVGFSLDQLRTGSIATTLR